MELTTHVCLVTRLRNVLHYTSIHQYTFMVPKHRDFTFYIICVCEKVRLISSFFFSVCIKSVTVLELVWNLFIFFTFILNTAKLSFSIHMQMDDFCCNRIIIVGTPIFPRSYTDCHNITTVK